MRSQFNSTVATSLLYQTLQKENFWLAQLRRTLFCDLNELISVDMVTTLSSSLCIPMNNSQVVHILGGCVNIENPDDLQSKTSHFIETKCESMNV